MERNIHHEIISDVNLKVLRKEENTELCFKIRRQTAVIQSEDLMYL